MASETAISAIISMALTYCRRHEVHEQKAAIAMWSMTFEHTDTQKLRTAVVRWAENLDEDAIRAQTLPLPQTLKRIMGEGRETINDEPTPRPEKADRAHVDAVKAANAKIFKLIARPANDKALRAERTGQAKHEHTEPTYDAAGNVVTLGNEECRACNAQELSDRDKAEKMAQVQEILETIPKPPEHDEDDRRYWTRCSRCGDGCGIIDTKRSLAAAEALSYVDTREVYPCPKCNTDLFHRWQQDDLSGAKAAAAE